MKDFHDKVVVITGAGSGIGLATARAFARAGARVHLVDIDPERLQAATAAAPLTGAGSHPVDCTDGEAVLRLADTIFTGEGRVDILHNNAGVCCGGPVQDIPIEDWKWSLDVNLWAVIHGIRAFVPRMIAQGRGGHIINTASMAGLIGLPYVAPYCASKFAVVGLSESLASEMAVHGIGVTTICPGAVKTNVLENGRMNLPGAWLDRFRDGIARYGSDPDQVAGEILRAVRGDRSLVVTAAGSMLPLWLIKRVSQSVYQGLNRLFFRYAKGL